jgi:hypothetical protein
MKRNLFCLFLICSLIALFSSVASAQEVFSVTATVRDVGADALKQAQSRVSEGFILVPEPSSIVLLGSGILALIRQRNKRNRKKG